MGGAAGPELQYSGLHVDVKPLERHPKWKSPRTFVFNDHTTSVMFLQSFPELLDEPANEAMQAVLDLIKQGDLDKAEEQLTSLTSIIGDLPVQVQTRVSYDQACIESMRAGRLSAGSEERKRALARLKGIEDRVWIKIEGQPRVYAIADEDLERESDQKTSSVHFLRFELAPAMISALKAGSGLAIGVDHPQYSAAVDPAPDATRSALLADLA